LPSSTNENIDNIIWINQETIDMKTARINQIIDELDNFFQDLEEILTKDLLNDDKIIKLVQEEINNNENNNYKEDFNELLPVSFVNAIKSLQNWIIFFE